MTNQKTIDYPSQLGQWGWEKIGSDEFAVPVIVRSNGIRYSPVRIVEQEIIKKYDALPQAIFQCITLKSFYLTQSEAKLLNDINFAHCNARYGDQGLSTKDVIIGAHDVKELSRFLNISHKIFNQDLSEFSQLFGIVRFYIDPHSRNYPMLLPYISKRITASNQSVARFIPSKLVERFVNMTSPVSRAMPSDWDIMYLKMLSIRCGNTPETLAQINKDPIIQLEGLTYLSTNTPVVYEEFTLTNRS